VVKRARATNKQKRWKRDAKAKDYELMTKAASEVVMQNRGDQYRTGNPEYVLFSFPHWVVFDKTFPKGFIVEKTLETNVYKINAIKLLDWLYKNGHSTYGSRQLLRNTRAFEEIDKRLDRMFNLIEGE
jgi:hypothetical protein